MGVGGKGEGHARPPYFPTRTSPLHRPIHGKLQKQKQKAFHHLSPFLSGGGWPPGRVVKQSAPIRLYVAWAEIGVRAGWGGYTFIHPRGVL